MTIADCGLQIADYDEITRMGAIFFLLPALAL